MPNIRITLQPENRDLLDYLGNSSFLKPLLRSIPYPEKPIRRKTRPPQQTGNAPSLRVQLTDTEYSKWIALGGIYWLAHYLDVESVLRGGRWPRLPE